MPPDCVFDVTDESFGVGVKRQNRSCQTVDGDRADAAELPVALAVIIDCEVDATAGMSVGEKSGEFRL
jgi:hypothetical protein